MCIYIYINKLTLFSFHMRMKICAKTNMKVYIYIFKSRYYIILRVYIFSNIHRYTYTNIQTYIFTFKILTLLTYLHALRFPCSQTSMVWLFTHTHRHTCVDQESCGAVFEPIFLENLRRLIESPIGVFVDGTKLVQHSRKPLRMMCHVAFGSRYQLDDTGT